MPSFYSWLFRLLLLAALCLLSITFLAVWPNDNVFRWIDLAGVSLIGVATLVVAIWTVTSWLEDISADPSPTHGNPPSKTLPPASAPQA